MDLETISYQTCPYGANQVLTVQQKDGVTYAKCPLASEIDRRHRIWDTYEKFEHRLKEAGCPNPHGKSYLIKRPECKYNQGGLEKVI
jgi:hypothetical protein